MKSIEALFERRLLGDGDGLSLFILFKDNAVADFKAEESADGFRDSGLAGAI